MEPFEPLSPEERQVVDEVQKRLESVERIPCTDCQYCVKGCPQKVVIPRIFSAMNTLLVYNNLEGAKGNYAWETRDGGKAGECVACGQCESACPQHIAIIDELRRASSLLEG